jgi:hypothetical protein
MYRLPLAAILLVAVPAVAFGAFETGSWTGQGKVPGALKKADRTVKITAVVKKGTCVTEDGADADGNTKTKAKKGTCVSFLSGQAYKASCRWINPPRNIVDEPFDKLVSMPGNYALSKTGKLDVTIKVDQVKPGVVNGFNKVTNRLQLTLSGKRGSGTATYRSDEAGIPARAICTAQMKIALKTR